MLTLDDARKIVHESVEKLSSISGISENHRLQKLGIDSDHSVATLIKVITVAISSIQGELGPTGLHDINSSLTVGNLVEKLRISGRKLCSNPSSPHEQPCCPYPKTCGDCGSPVR